MISLTDALGAQHTFDAPPQRIVSLVPSLTESLIELGVRDRVVGCTEWCVHPLAVTSQIPKVGGTKNVSVRKVLELQPDLVIANREENRERHVEALREHVPVFVTYPRTVDDALETVNALGRLTGCDKPANDIVARARRTLAHLAADSRPPVRVLCLIWRDPWMAAGRDTYMNDLLFRCGFDNVIDDAESRYPEIDLAGTIADGVDVILLPDEPYEFGGADAVEVCRIRDDAGSDCQVTLFYGSVLTWFGVRTLRGIEDLVALRNTL